jgi:hypothetical protein
MLGAMVRIGMSRHPSGVEVPVNGSFFWLAKTVWWIVDEFVGNWAFPAADIGDNMAERPATEPTGDGVALETPGPDWRLRGYTLRRASADDLRCSTSTLLGRPRLRGGFPAVLASSSCKGSCAIAPPLLLYEAVLASEPGRMGRHASTGLSAREGLGFRIVLGFVGRVIGPAGCKGLSAEQFGGRASC